MNLLEAIIFGIIQGLTEFLPVSSSGHIELAKVFFGDNNMPSEGMLFTIVVHAATALSTCVIFRKDLLVICKGIFKLKFNEHWKFVIAIGLSMVPAGIVGLLFEKELEAFFYKNILLVGTMLLITGLLLFLADRAKQSKKEISWITAVLIGMAQAIAIMPGISRSGATIGTSVLLGIDRTKAARFSFLMVIPLIFGAMILKGKKFIEVSNLEELNIENRVELVINEASNEGIFEPTQLVSLIPSLVMREDIWSELKTKEGLSINEINDARSKIEVGLVNAGCNSNQIDFLMNDNFAGFRPLNKTPISSLLGGFLAAFFTGLFACKWMISLVKKSKLKYFAFYCILIGFISIIYASF
mgnify:CR=1 FL=1